MGIDYGRGLTNIDHDTGIRYGVLPPSLAPDWLGADAEGEYPPLEYDCPHCATTIVEECSEEYDECPHCGGDVREVRANANALGEPSGFKYSSEGVQMYQNAGDSDWWVFKSPYAMRCDFCSPCAPGAGYVNGSGHDTFAYCPPPDWFSAETLAAMENKPVLVRTAQIVMKVEFGIKAKKFGCL